ncbi:MAG: hypothetical protein QXM52_00685 [Candidatus Bathyarchaeia archaeon]
MKKKLVLVVVSAILLLLFQATARVHFILLASANFIPPPVPPPTISILHPENKTYSVNNISLSFIGEVYSPLTEPTPSVGIGDRIAKVCYSLDGQKNVTIKNTIATTFPKITITGTETLHKLSEGSHSLIVYIWDVNGGVGSSAAVHFTIDTTPPIILILSPENKSYITNNIQLNITLNEAASWMGYILDGEANVTITGNITLMDLSYGSHTLVVYAEDTAENVRASETIHFTVNPPSASWTNPIVSASAMIATCGAAIVLGVVFYRKRKSIRGEEVNSKWVHHRKAFI